MECEQSMKHVVKLIKWIELKRLQFKWTQKVKVHIQKYLLISLILFLWTLVFLLIICLLV